MDKSLQCEVDDFEKSWFGDECQRSVPNAPSRIQPTSGFHSAVGFLQNLRRNQIDLQEAIQVDSASTTEVAVPRQIYRPNPDRDAPQHRNHTLGYSGDHRVNRSETPASLLSTVVSHDSNKNVRRTCGNCHLGTTAHPSMSAPATHLNRLTSSIVDLTREDAFEDDNGDDLSVSSTLSTIILDTSPRGVAEAGRNGLSQTRQAHFELPYRSRSPPAQPTPRTPTRPTGQRSQTSLPRVHRWTADERTLLCVMRRWYQQDWHEFESLFYEYFRPEFERRMEQPLRGVILSTQWSNLKRLESNAEFSSVIHDVEFNDPEGTFQHIRSRIEDIAATLGIELHRVQDEDPNNYLLRSHTTPSPGRNRVHGLNTGTIRSQGDRDVLFQAPYVKDSMGYLVEPQLDLSSPEPAENDLDSEAGTSSPSKRPRTSHQAHQVYHVPMNGLASANTRTEAPAVLFRCFDELSHGTNGAQLFKAELFKSSPNAVPEPVSDYAMLLVFASNHLWNHQVGSPFVATTDSLPWVLHRAAKSTHEGRHPRIAVIDGSRASRGGRLFHASDLVPNLKSQGLCNGMRYRGFNEWLVWGDIKRDAIITVLTINDIRGAMNTSPALGAVMPLDVLNPAKLLSTVRNALFASPSDLDALTIATGVSQAAILLGIYPTSHMSMITKVVYDILQGWIIDIPDEAEAGEEGQPDTRISAIFVKEFIEASRADITARMRLGDDIRAAFLKGRQLATETLRRERRSKERTRSRSRSTPRKKRRVIVDSDDEKDE